MLPPPAVGGTRPARGTPYVRIVFNVWSMLDRCTKTSTICLALSFSSTCSCAMAALLVATDAVSDAWFADMDELCIVASTMNETIAPARVRTTLTAAQLM